MFKTRHTLHVSVIQIIIRSLDVDLTYLSAFIKKLKRWHSCTDCDIHMPKWQRYKCRLETSSQWDSHVDVTHANPPPPDLSYITLSGQGIARKQTHSRWYRVFTCPNTLFLWLSIADDLANKCRLIERQCLSISVNVTWHTPTYKYVMIITIYTHSYLE